MRHHLFAYRPTNDFNEGINQFASPLSSWEDESLYKLDTKWSDKEFRNWIQELTDNSELITHICHLENTDERLFFKDLEPNSPIQDIIKRESPGGDIRKYTTDIYGGCDYSINYKLFRSKIPTITGFEPLSTKTVKEFVELGIVPEYLDEGSWYPSASKILQWAERVEAQFGLECGVMGSIHFDSDGPRGGFDGFVIYGADQGVMDWVEERWTSEAEEPFMCPSELTLYDGSDVPLVSDGVIRMWWD